MPFSRAPGVTAHWALASNERKAAHDRVAIVVAHVSTASAPVFEPVAIARETQLARVLVSQLATSPWTPRTPKSEQALNRAHQVWANVAHEDSTGVARTSGPASIIGAGAHPMDPEAITARTTHQSE
jgi:hypothetical protein